MKKRKTQILALESDDSRKELEFEIDFQLSLTPGQRYEILDRLVVVDDVADDVFLKKEVSLRDHLFQTDIHPFVKGVDLSRVWRSRKGTTIKGLKVYVPALDDLISMEKAAGRPKDKEDLKLLPRVKRKLESKDGR